MSVNRPRPAALEAGAHNGAGFSRSIYDHENDAAWRLRSVAAILRAIAGEVDRIWP